MEWDLPTQHMQHHMYHRTLDGHHHHHINKCTSNRDIYCTRTIINMDACIGVEEEGEIVAVVAENNVTICM